MFWCLELTLGGRQCMHKEYPPRAKTAIIENNREWNQSMDMEVNGTNQKCTYWRILQAYSIHIQHFTLNPHFNYVSYTASTTCSLEISLRG